MLIEAPPFNIQIKEVLRSGRAVARCNASVKNDVIGVYWVIIDRETKEIIMEREVYAKE